MKRYRIILVIIITLLLTVTLGTLGAHTWWNRADAAGMKSQSVVTNTASYREVRASYFDPWDNWQVVLPSYGPSFAPSEEVFRLITVRPGSDTGPSTDFYSVVPQTVWPVWASTGGGGAGGGGGGNGGGGSPSEKLIKSLTEDGSNCGNSCNLDPSKGGLDQPAPVPLPGSAWLFLNALFAIMLFAKRARA